MPAADPTAPDLPLRGAGPVTAYVRFWARYVVLTGRASRSEFWWTHLWHTATFLVLLLFGTVLTVVGDAQGVEGVVVALDVAFWLLVVAYTLAIVVPVVALSVRRLHDADLSGRYLLLALLPVVGWPIVLVLHLLPSDAAGRRFDEGAGSAAVGPLSAPPPAAGTGPVGVMEPGPAVLADADHPVTSPLPVAGRAPEPPAAEVWSTVGDVQAVAPPFAAPASWRRVGYRRITLPDGRAILGTAGLAVAEGVAALGAGAELWIAADPLPSAAELPGSWWFALVAGAARRVAASGAHLPAELAEYGALSMAVPAPQAPPELQGDDGTVGVLLGIGDSGVPDTVVTPAGEVRLVGALPLTPDQLRRIVAGGRDARAALASELTRGR